MFSLYMQYILYTFYTLQITIQGCIDKTVQLCFTSIQKLLRVILTLSSFFFLPHHLNLNPNLLNAYSSICIAQFLKINDNFLFTQLHNAQSIFTSTVSSKPPKTSPGWQEDILIPPFQREINLQQVKCVVQDHQASGQQSQTSNPAF